jgi:hypothetical protein
VTTAPADAAALPPYTFRHPCRRCRRRANALVVFERDCGEVVGAHYHRECLACGARWVEQGAASPDRDRRGVLS